MPDLSSTDPRIERSHGSVWVVVALAVLAAYAISRMGPFGRTPAMPQAVGLELTDLELKGLTGTDQSVTLDDLRGHVTLINFWATWCGPCRLEFPHLLNLEDRFRQQPDFRLLSVCFGPLGEENAGELRASAEAFLKGVRAKIPTYADWTGRTRRAVVPLLVPTDGADPLASQPMPLPATILLDRQLIVRAVWLGFSPSAAKGMEQMVAQLVKEQAAASMQQAPGNSL